MWQNNVNGVKKKKKKKKKTGFCLVYVRGFIDETWKLLNTRETSTITALSCLAVSRVHPYMWTDGS